MTTANYITNYSDVYIQSSNRSNLKKNMFRLFCCRSQVATQINFKKSNFEIEKQNTLLINTYKFNTFH